MWGVPAITFLIRFEIILGDRLSGPDLFFSPPKMGYNILFFKYIFQYRTGANSRFQILLNVASAGPRALAWVSLPVNVTNVTMESILCNRENTRTWTERISGGGPDTSEGGCVRL